MKTLLTVVISVMLCQGMFAQYGSTQMADIDKTKQGINNNITNLKKIETLKGNTGGYRYAYAKDKKLQLVTFCAKDQGISKYVEWYFNNGNMIYSEQNWINDTTGAVVDNEKIYLNDSHPIAWIKADNNAVDTTTKEFKSMAKAMEAYAQKLQDRYTDIINKDKE